MKTSETISPERQYNTRLGLILFVIYLLLYLGFVLGNAFMADVMEKKVLLGLNLAIVYGFTLIKMAFVLSMIYGWMCRTEPQTPTEIDSIASEQDGAASEASARQDQGSAPQDQASGEEGQ